MKIQRPILQLCTGARDPFIWISCQETVLEHYSFIFCILVCIRALQRTLDNNSEGHKNGDMILCICIIGKGEMHPILHIVTGEILKFKSFAEQHRRRWQFSVNAAGKLSKVISEEVLESCHTIMVSAHSLATMNPHHIAAFFLRLVLEVLVIISVLNNSLATVCKYFWPTVPVEARWK